jgi:hypothetical protein
MIASAGEALEIEKLRWHSFMMSRIEHSQV